MLGRGPPGGSWSRFNPNLRTLSLSAWMSLPNLNFNEWNAAHPHIIENKLCNAQLSDRESCRHNKTNNNSNFLNCDNKHSEISIRNYRNSSNINSNTVALTTTKNAHSESEDSEDQEKMRLIKHSRKFIRSPSKEVETRALVSRVAEYYEQYVQLMGLGKYFVNDVLVTSVSPIKSYVDAAGVERDAKWLVMG